MNELQLLELWEKRFERLLKVERDSASYYMVLLKQYEHLLGGTRLKQILRRIMREEADHIMIAKKLLEIVKNKRENLENPKPANHDSLKS